MIGRQEQLMESPQTRVCAVVGAGRHTWTEDVGESEVREEDRPQVQRLIGLGSASRLTRTAG